MIHKEGKAPACSGAELIVRNLQAHGVTHVFGIPGAKIDRLFEALEDSPITTIVTRHEQNAAFIAGGIGRLTGKAGVAVATSGPGVSNLTTGLVTATSEGDPVLAIGGAVRRSDLTKLTHQSMDTVSMLRPVTKYSAELTAPEAISEIMANAFRTAEADRPGAAFLSAPMDVLSLPAEAPVLSGASAPVTGPAAPDLVQEAVRALKAAKRPVILLGMLASRPDIAREVRLLIRQSGAPVVGCYQAAGAISRELVGRFGGRVGLFRNQHGDQLLHEADLVMAIGYNPIEYDPALWNLKPSRPLITVDSVPAQLDNAFAPSIELVGNVAQTLRHLTREVGALSPSPEMEAVLAAYRQAQHSALHAARSACQGLLHPLEIVRALEPFVAQDVTLCLDMGSFHIWLARYLLAFRARQMLISNGQQTMGVGLPWGIAASLLNPAQKVISISGDGGFMMSAMELETAVRLRCNLIHLIWIDHSYNMVKIQEEKKYGREAGVAFGPVDFALYARACGATGVNVTSAEGLKAALREAMDAQGPVVIAIPVDYADNPDLMKPLPSLGGAPQASA